MKKILIISDIHLGKSGEISIHPGIIKQTNSKAKEAFEKLIPKFREINPDLVVNLGDFIKVTREKAIDRENLQEVFKFLKKTKLPMIQLLGNHELWAFSREEIDKILENELGEKSKFFGLMDLGFLQVMWLDFEIDKNKRAFVSEERLEWIKENVKEDKPLLVFSHYSLVPIDSKGSFYFENTPEDMFIKNKDEVLAVFDGISAKVFINAHVHFLSHKQVDGRHFISSPAFSEKMKVEKAEGDNLGLYSILEIDENKFVFTSYSGEFCFGKIEGEV